MKKIAFLFILLSFGVQAQVKLYDNLYFCDQMIVNTNNSVQCLHRLCSDLKEYKKKSSFVFRYFDSYNCIKQPDPKAYDKIKNGTNAFYKAINSELWKLYNDCYEKNGEIIAYLRLEDYKTDLDKGFRLVREMQQLQIAMGKARDKIAAKVSTEAKSVATPAGFVHPYQLLMKAIQHEDELIRTLSENFNEETFIGYPKEEILKSFLEMDDMLQVLHKLRLPTGSYLKSTVEGLEFIQKTKQHSLDEFNNTSTLNGEYLNALYDNLQSYLNNDILHFYSNFCAEAGLAYYPVAIREYDFDLPEKPWPLTHLSYSLPLIDSLPATKQPAPLPVSSFNQLNEIVYYIDECVRSMSNLYKELRSEESTWNDLREGDIPHRNPLIKFDKFFIPVSLHGLLIKESKNLPAPYRKNLVDQINDIEQIMLALQDHVIELSQYMSSGAFRDASMDFLETKLKTIETLYSELDIRKERLFLFMREVYDSYPLRKTNSWTITSTVLLKATDDSRSILKQVDAKVYKQAQSPISTSAIHEDQRDLIINQLKYMKGIVRVGKNNGLCPYNPYEYIPGNLKTLEEKVNNFPASIDNKYKTYGDILYMHNAIVYQYNKFAELGLGGNEYSVNDPMRPVYLLSYIRQPPKFYYEPPKPKEPEQKQEPESVAEVSQERTSFEGYAFNNIVLLLDVSASTNKPDRLPLLKESFQQLVRLMRTEDEVSIVIYSGRATVHLPPLSASDTTKIMRAIETLRSEGNTNILDGLNLAYKTANKNFIEDGNNKIILATDGEFNTSEALYKLVEKNPKVDLSVFDFSQKPEAIASIELLAEKGKGNYIKVTPENSLHVLVNEAQKKKQ